MNKQISADTTDLKFPHQYNDKSENFNGNTNEFTYMT